MEKDENKKIDNIEKLVEIIATNVFKLTDKVDNIEKKMVTKDDLEAFKLETNVHFNNLESDLKSFKKDNGESIKEIKNDIIDLEDTDMHHDKRIEKLENKVFV